MSKPHLYLQFYYIAAAVMCTGYVVLGPHNFWGAPVDQPAPTKYGTKAVIVTHSPNPSSVPNLKLLASVVADISRGSQIFWDAPQAKPPANFGSKVVFGKQLPVPK